MRGNSHADDGELVRRIAAGDKNAFSELMRRHLSAAVNFSRQYLAQDAEDIAQEALLRLWTKAPQWADRGISPKAWLLRVCYNLCVDELRKRKPVAAEAESMLSFDPRSCSERQLGAQADLHQQMLALQALPERQRSAITLCACSGLSNREAAAVLDISVEALESLLARGRRALKKTFFQATGYNSEEINHDYR